MDISGYEVSDLDNVEFYWEYDQFNVDIVFRPGIATPFSSSNFNDFEMGPMAENPILIDEEQDKEDSPPPLLSTPVLARPTQLIVLMRSHPFGSKIVKLPDFVFRNLIELLISLLLSLYFDTYYS